MISCNGSYGKAVDRTASLKSSVVGTQHSSQTGSRTWALAGNANYPAPPQTNWVRKNGGGAQQSVLASLWVTLRVWEPLVLTTNPANSHWAGTVLGLGLRTLWSESASRSAVSDFLWPHGLYSPWNSPGQKIRVSSCSLLQGIFPTQGSNPGLPHCSRFFTSWATREDRTQRKNFVRDCIVNPSQQPFSGITK